MLKFEELRVYQESISFVDEIYSITKEWPKEETFGLTNQIRRASVSIALNIAEGTSRSKKDFKRFIDMARGSCFECVTVLTIAHKRYYITQSSYDMQYMTCVKLIKMLQKLKVSLTNN